MALVHNGTLYGFYSNVSVFEVVVEVIGKERVYMEGGLTSHFRHIPATILLRSFIIYVNKERI